MFVSVSRRMLVDKNNTQDAFQATFIVLALKAQPMARGQRSVTGSIGSPTTSSFVTIPAPPAGDAPKRRWRRWLIAPGGVTYGMVSAALPR
jgi:hypothetical protein